MFDKLTRISVLEAIRLFDQVGRDAFLKISGFGEAREYLILHNGKLYDSKAIAAVAARQLGTDLSPQTCTGGVTNGAAVITLSRLGFQVVRKSRLQEDAYLVRAMSA